MDLIEVKGEHIVQVALDQVESILRDLGKHSSEGYILGYELGYMKGVLEHVLKGCPQSAHDRELYIKGFVRGYAQGILYTVQRREMGLSAMATLGNPDSHEERFHSGEVSGREEGDQRRPTNRLEVHGRKCGTEDHV